MVKGHVHPLKHVLGEEILLNASNLNIKHVSYLWNNDSIQRMYLCHSLGPHSCPICFINKHFTFNSISFFPKRMFGERRTFPSLPNIQISLCHVPNFALDHNGLITFSIFMRVCQIDVKGQIIAEENY